MSKTKKQNINQELVVGGIFILLAIPIALFGMACVVLAIMLGWLLVMNNSTQVIGVPVLITYGLILLAFGWVFQRIIKRVLLLLNRKRQLRAEYERVTDMIDTASAESRLQEKDLTSPADDTYDDNDDQREQHHH